ncbi:DUF6401 family natural product biosynthesis protein [Pseudonocardia yuanmonensis]|uniref:DUF6401 family natural product biosynthesis protein n=1 Tax=Pseudonocardia yuanmonensis TaxID=1095914 RepID=UPI0031EB589F
MSGTTGVFTERSARRWLAQLHDQVGCAGLVAAAAVPGLAAVVDQHAAAVRDATTIGLESTAMIAGLALLAGYAHGVLTHARAHGWRPPADDLTSWERADWTSLRLVAVCALAPTRHLPPPQLPPWGPSVDGSRA